jgi:hypothetical protein
MIFLNRLEPGASSTAFIAASPFAFVTVKPLGHGLDLEGDRSREAVSLQASYAARVPVPVEVNIEVNFIIY